MRRQKNTPFSIKNHKLKQAKWCPSPNFNARPTDEISLLVIHNISLPPNEFNNGHIEAFFQNRLDISAHPYFEQIADLKVSAHLLIAKDGTVTQFVEFNQRAWHAGQSLYQGRKNCNDFSIGIELEGVDNQAYTQAQYESLINATKAIMHTYPNITPNRITGHEHIAPSRKTDPSSSFKWQAYFKGLLS